MRRGTASEHAFTADRARARVPVPTDDSMAAHAMFRLGQLLIRRGETDESHRFLQEASRRHPESWCIWRQSAGVTELGLAALLGFWARVDALGDKRHYSKVDIERTP